MSHRHNGTAEVVIFSIIELVIVVRLCTTEKALIGFSKPNANCLSRMAFLLYVQKHCLSVSPPTELLLFHSLVLTGNSIMQSFT